jgi:hypothetical protein
MSRTRPVLLSHNARVVFGRHHVFRFEQVRRVSEGHSFIVCVMNICVCFILFFLGGGLFFFHGYLRAHGTCFDFQTLLISFFLNFLAVSSINQLYQMV